MGFDLTKYSGNTGDGEFIPFIEDRYNLEVTKATAGVAQSMNPKIDVEFTVRGGDFNNRKVWTTFTLTETAIRFLMDYLIAAGSDAVNNKNIEGEEIALEIMGTKTNAVITPAGLTPTQKPKYTVSKYQTYVAVEEEEKEEEEKDAFAV